MHTSIISRRSPVQCERISSKLIGMQILWWMRSVEHFDVKGGSVKSSRVLQLQTVLSAVRTLGVLYNNTGRVVGELENNTSDFLHVHSQMALIKAVNWTIVALMISSLKENSVISTITWKVFQCQVKPACVKLNWQDLNENVGMRRGDELDEHLQNKSYQPVCELCYRCRQW